jgi:outer membrane lipoprotein-sorting protein
MDEILLALSQKSFEVNLTQEIYSDFRKTTLKSKGSFSFMPPKSFKWNLESQRNYQNDGTWIWESFPVGSRTYVKKHSPKDIQLGFLDLIQNPKMLRKTYHIKSLPTALEKEDACPIPVPKDAKQGFFRLTPVNKEDSGKSLIFSQEKEYPHYIFILDKTASCTLITFTDFKVKKWTKEDFVFKVTPQMIIDGAHETRENSTK